MNNQNKYSTYQKVSLLLGIPIFLAILLLLHPTGLSPEGQKTLAIAVLMAFWWITEALPIPATALIPLALFPALGIMSYRDVAPNYSDSVIFLFMGGFLLAMAMQKWQLHKRLALRIVSVIGTSSHRIVLGFMTASAFISMMISNTSTTLLMYPIGLAVILQLAELKKANTNEEKLDDGTHFQTALLLGIAYASSVGGIATLIGTPPNVIFAGVVTSIFPQAPAVGFFQWMLIGVPLSVLFIPVIWICLTRLIFPLSRVEVAGGKQVIRQQLAQLGKITRGERLTLIIFIVTAFALIFRRDIDLHIITIPGWSDWLGLSALVSDTTVVMFAALLMFAIPVDLKKGEFVLDWQWAVKIPWGLLLLFGGGIALAKGFQTTGLAAWLGSHLTYLQNVPVILMILSICLLLTFLTELTSNTAITTIFMPILASTAVAMHTHPFLLMIPAAMSASCAFMLPVATPPNAIIFGSGYIRISQMTRAGFALNILGAVLITLLVYLLALPVFNISPGTVPVWAQ
ncbi:MAG: SLC13 family permease [bacterium]